MRYRPIAQVIIPAVAAPTNWVRTAKVVYISATTPKWMVDIITDVIKEAR